VLQNGISPFALFGIPFVCVGIYIVIGRFFHTAWLRKRTYYVITNRKIIRLRNKKVDVLMGANLPQFSVEAYQDGSGSIYFGQHPSQLQFGMRNTATDRNSFALENIPDVVRVQQHLTQMISK